MGGAAELAGRYFTAWQAGDEAGLRQVLAEGVTFRGPLGTAEGRDECIAGDAPHYRVHQAQAQPKHCEAG